MQHSKLLRHSRTPIQYINQLPDTIKGIAFALISNALFIGVGALVRTLSESLDVFQILLFRQLVFIVLLLPAITKNVDHLLKPKMLPFHILRVTGAFISLYLGFLTVSNIPFAEATALGFLKVIFVAIISRLFLSEMVNAARMLTITIGFIGVIMVVQPAFDNTSTFYTLMGVIASIGAAVAVICVRKMAAVESKTVVLVYQAVFVGLIAIVPSVLAWQWPTTEQWILLMLVGVISSIAQWFGVTAYKWGEANVIANVEYTQMIYSIALGYWLFSETPNALAIVGVGVILGSSLLPYIKPLFKRPATR
ncbi:DMT family transporter [Vibrio sp. T187]|uniref:DMT family transporter n=1 Tax=Vibrio TaxID=662 RepID=UPI0010C9926C|nr:MULTISPECIES: DMT family transporter [Vibrio]MBW3698245.1 DMT family transporter [Vibrio sp. T187]